ncbi:MAG: M2 family metallopeptidase [Elusimicrobia bacterium]|nr:M2 family metallopeptidase [Elusimicrobiota bacterium]
MQRQIPGFLISILLAAPLSAAPSPGAGKMIKAGVKVIVTEECSSSPAGDIEKEAEAFVKAHNGYYQGLYAVSQEASWDASTDVTPEHDGGRIAANKAMASFTGSRYVIEQVQRFLARKGDLQPLTVRQLEKIRLAAAENPATLPEIAAKRVEAEGRQSSAMDSFVFCLEKNPDASNLPNGVGSIRPNLRSLESLDGSCAKPTTANEIDDLLVSTRDLSVRLKVWEASKEIGPVLKPGLAELRALRNAVAKSFGFSSYFGLQTADYGMTAAEMSALLDGFLRDIRPLYEQLHCWTKYELAKRYGQPPPKLIPAHWLGNRWSQEWPGIVEGMDLDPYFKDRKPSWFVKAAEDYYVSLGFDRLPESFWKKSDLYALPLDSKRKKNTHASAWNIDLSGDMRSLMNIKPDREWFMTAHHELGHIFYYQAYTRPDVPFLLREGANRAFHEGIAELGSLASMRQSYLRRLGVLPAGKEIDQTRWLLNEALVETVSFLPWAAGTVSAWERDIYENNLSTAQWNARWWEHVAKYQGVKPPSPRAEEYCDACTKTHLNDNPVYYYNYAIATVLKYHLHTYICRNIAKQDPRTCDYSNSKEAGAFLKGLLSAGATRDWRELLREKTGSDLSTKAMMDYFEPLTEFLKKENSGRSCAW